MVNKPVTERDVQLAIVRDLGSSIVCAAPNYTPGQWWECDLWTVTRSGYAVEYEIKRSVADFRADADPGTFAITPRERALGDYTPGRFGWVLSRRHRLSKPIPFRGRQGLFEIPDHLVMERA